MGGSGQREAGRTASAGRAVLALAVACVGWAVHADGARPYVGRTLADVLDELEREGLALIYSSAVVHPQLVVTVEPVSSEPRTMLEEMLEPLGLELRDGPRRTLRVVASRGGTSVIGLVLSSVGTDPVGGATIRVPSLALVAYSNADGSFRLAGVPPGTHRLSVEAEGFVPVSLMRVRVSPADGADVTVRLSPRPAFTTSVVVTPGRHAVLAQDALAARTIEHEDALLVPNVSGDVSRVLQRLPGLSAPEHSASFYARGSLAADSALVLDGLELYDPFHLGTLESPFSLIDNHAVDRIEFLGGGFTADYGDRHGAFVEITTLSTGGAARGELELGTLNSRVFYGAPLPADRGSWLVSARGWYPEALYDSLEPGEGEQLRPRFADIYAKLERTITPRAWLSAHALLARDRLDYAQSEDDAESVSTDIDSGYAWLRLVGAPRAGLTLRSVLSGGSIDRSRSGTSVPDAGPFTVRDVRDVDFFGWTNDASWELSAQHLLRGGFYARHLAARYDYSSVDAADPGATRIVALDPDGTSVGAFVSYRTRVSRELTSEIGLRWDRQDYTGDNQVSPRLNLLWRASERSELRFAVGRFQQSQRIHELHVEDGQTAFLPAEVSEQAELTFQHRLAGGLRLRVDAYLRTLSDVRPRYENLFEPVELFPETGADRVEIAPDEARLRGLELMLGSDGERPLAWWVSYVRSVAEDVLSGEEVPRSWDQPHAGSFLVAYRWGERWLLSASGTAHTGWPTTPVSGTVVVDREGATTLEPAPGERNSARFPDYWRLDLEARRTFLLSRSRLSLSLDAFNVTDRDNACCADEFQFTPRPDGTVETTTVYGYWVGFTPAFSVRWEF